MDTCYGGKGIVSIQIGGGKDGKRIYCKEGSR